jgi:hypothetical protein
MTPEIVKHIVKLSLELVESSSYDCVFDTTTLQDYIDYFTAIVLNENQSQVILIINNKRYQEAIGHLSQRSPVSHGGRKTNNKKLTKRRPAQRRLYKQYSKKKRNTSSYKKNKRVSIKHKRSRTNYHDTRKRRK